MTIKSKAGRVLSDDSQDAESRSLAGYLLQAETIPGDRRSGEKGVTDMADKDIKADDVPVEVAKEVVEKDRAASKDGVAQARTDAASNIVMEPNSPDKSVLTYDGSDPKVEKPAKAEKSPYRSGEPVHDRS